MNFFGTHIKLGYKFAKKYKKSQKTLVKLGKTGYNSI